jgi:hypothetical protein
VLLRYDEEKLLICNISRIFVLVLLEACEWPKGMCFECDKSFERVSFKVMKLHMCSLC